MNSLTKMLMAILCISVFSCTRNDNKPYGRDNIDQLISHFSSEGGDADDFPIIITHLTDPQGLDIESAIVIFVQGQDTILANPVSGGNYIAHLGEYGIRDMYAYATGYHILFKPEITITDSLTLLSGELQPE